jgi:hypothetical protein
MNAKFTYFTSPKALPDTEAPYDYGQRYMLEEYPSYSRLKISASDHGIRMLLKLSECLMPPFYCLYVLVVGRTESEPGRYQSPVLASREELVDFLLDYQSLFESDGRHHLWISVPDGYATLVYDKHNLIYAYGAKDEFIEMLQAMDYIQEDFEIPFPHGHNYLSESDARVEDLLHYWEWQHFPLQETDEE